MLASACRTPDRRSLPLLLLPLSLPLLLLLPPLLPLLLPLSLLLLLLLPLSLLLLLLSQPVVVFLPQLLLKQLLMGCIRALQQAPTMTSTQLNRQGSRTRARASRVPTSCGVGTTPGTSRRLQVGTGTTATLSAAAERAAKTRLSYVQRACALQLLMHVFEVCRCASSTAGGVQHRWSIGSRCAAWVTGAEGLGDDK
jgi:hypothetical protein